MIIRSESIVPTILVVDDNPTNVELIRAQLKPFNYHLVCAYDGEEALARVKEQSPDLVLLDLMMPKLSGYEVCKILKNNPATQLIPVVIVTALRDLEDKLKSIELGADDFLIKPFNKLELVTRVKSLLRLRNLYSDLDRSESIVFALIEALEAKDPYTRGHSERVAYFGGMIGEAISLSSDELATLKKACRLHDIGKVGVREEVLNKEGKLSPEEIEHVRTHPMRGYEICKPLKSFKPLLGTILYHHERMDGKGWPEGLVGADVPLFARICSIADTYDAMTSDRSYRRAMTPLQAVAILEREAGGGQWDTELLDLFMKKIRSESALLQSA